MRNSSRAGTEGKQSYESLSPRLQKKKSLSIARPPRSSGGPAPISSFFGSKAEGVDGFTRADSGFAPGGMKSRKPSISIRDTVKRIFGRRSRDDSAPQPFRSSPPRHTYHYSEPRAFGPTFEESEKDHPEHGYPQSPPLDPYKTPSSPPPFGRVQSPSAALFPKSAQLQPLDLGNPFQRKELRRRKTLPSVMLDNSDAEAVATVAAALGTPRQPLPTNQSSPYRESRTAGGSSSRHTKRLSRSTDDLRALQLQSVDPPRKRSEEIKYWRESMQSIAPVTTAILAPASRSGTAEGDRVGDRIAGSVEAKDDPFGPRAISPPNPLLPSGPPLGHRRGHSGVSDAGTQSHLSIGLDMSRELEDRVAKLEAGLQTFQRSLQQLTTDRGSRTGSGRAGLGSRRSSGDLRTPGILPETLVNSLSPQAPVVSYEPLRDASRPSTSPQPFRPRTPTRYDASAPPLPPPPAFERHGSTRPTAQVDWPSPAHSPPTSPIFGSASRSLTQPSPPPVPLARSRTGPSNAAAVFQASTFPEALIPQSTATTLTNHMSSATTSFATAPQSRAGASVLNIAQSQRESTHDQRPHRSHHNHPHHHRSQQPSFATTTTPSTFSATTAAAPSTPHTFHTLYQMLADERTARRRLEDQLRGLRAEISDLHSQVASSTSGGPSGPASARSSYVARNSLLSAAAGGNSRLRDILMDVESSPPGTADGNAGAGGGISESARQQAQSPLQQPPPAQSQLQQQQQQQQRSHHLRENSSLPLSALDLHRLSAPDSFVTESQGRNSMAADAGRNSSIGDARRNSSAGDPRRNSSVGDPQRNSRIRDSQLSISMPPVLVSRFSGSESEAGATTEGEDVFETPVEESAAERLARHRWEPNGVHGDDSEMF